MAYTYNYTPQIEALQKQIDNYGQFQYGKENAYQKALAAVTNPTAFSYDVENDPVYSAYRKQYLREGDRAMADTLAKLSAMTGGRPSSYAVTAAQQAGNYYNSQLTDVIPTLYQNAYQRYLDGLDRQKDALSILEADREAALKQYQSGYDALLDKLQQLQEQQNTSVVTEPTYNQVLQDRQDLQTPAVMGVPTSSALDRFNRAKETAQASGILTPPTFVEVNSEATDLFKAALMTRREFSRTGDRYKSYEDYVEATIDQWLNNGQLTENEAATLMRSYGFA